MAVHHGGRGPGHLSRWAKAAGTSTPPDYHIVINLHTDSRGQGSFAATRPGVDDIPAGITQYVTGTGTADYSYPVSLGLTADMPIQGPTGYTSTDYLSPAEYMARPLLDEATVSGVTISGAHKAAATVVGGTIGPLPASTTVYGVAKAGATYAAVGTAYPDRTRKPLIFCVVATNDIAFQPTTTGQQIYDNILLLLADLRTATGFSNAPIVVASLCPERADGFEAKEAAMRIAALQTANTYYYQTPTGIGFTHEGESPGTGAPSVRTVGETGWGPAALVALGFSAATSPTFSITDNFEVTEGSDLEITLGCDQPVYYTGVTAGGSLVELSPDLELGDQVLRPVGGAWPAYDAGTPANNTRSYTLSYITGGRLTGTVTRNLVITENVAVTYLAWDNFNRADVAVGSGALGTTPGDGSTGGGLSWVGNGGIVSNKASTHLSATTTQCLVDVGVSYVEVDVDVAFGGTIREPRIFLASDTYKVYLELKSMKVFQTTATHGTSLCATGTALANGTYHVKFRLNTNKTFEVWIDTVSSLTGTLVWTSDVTDPLGTKAGIGQTYADATINFDNFTVVAV